MTQIKTFTSSDLEDIEGKVNSFMQESKVVVIDIKYTHQGYVDKDDRHWVEYTCLVIYYEIGLKYMTEVTEVDKG